MRVQLALFAAAAPPLHSQLHSHAVFMDMAMVTKDRRRRLIATDGTFSMDGVIAPLKDICCLAEDHDALILIDDCHASGFLGPTGRGTDEFHGVTDRVALVNSTLGKALGGAMGGYTTGPKEIIDLLRQRSRPYLFSNSLAPPVVGSSIKALDLLMSAPMAGSLAAKTTLFRNRMISAGFTLAGDPAHPICPVMLGDAKLAGEFAEKMLGEGIFVIGFSYPVVPVGKARIRVQISAAHTDEQINAAVDAFTNIGKNLGVI